MNHTVQTVQIPVGDKPGWEEGEGGISMIVDDEEDEEEEAKLLRSIPESLILLHSLRQSRQKWITTPPLVRFSIRSRAKNAVEIPQPPHNLNFLGRSDVEIGPHIFPDTKLVEVLYDTLPGMPVYVGGVPQYPPMRTDILIEFKENTAERFLLPLDCALVERVIEHSSPTVLLSTIVSATPSEPVEGPLPQEPITFRFVHVGASMWEAIERRVNASPLSLSQIQQSLKQAISSPRPRVYLPHRLPEGPLFNNVSEAVLDKFAPKPLVLKELRVGPPVPVKLAPTSKRKAPAVTAASGAQRESSAASGSAAGTTGEGGGEGGAPKKKYERRIKVQCSTCGKQIARKAQDVGKDSYKAYCRSCATEAKKKVVISGPRRSPHPGSSVPLPAHWTSGTSQHPPPSYNYYPSRPPTHSVHSPYASTYPPHPGQPYGQMAGAGTPSASQSSSSSHQPPPPLPYPVQAISSPYPAPGNPYAYAYRQPAYPPVAPPYSGSPYGSQGYYSAQAWRSVYAPSASILPPPGSRSPRSYVPPQRAPPPTDPQATTRYPLPHPALPPHLPSSHPHPYYQTYQPPPPLPLPPPPPPPPSSSTASGAHPQSSTQDSAPVSGSASNPAEV